VLGLPQEETKRPDASPKPKQPHQGSYLRVMSQ